MASITMTTKTQAYSSGAEVIPLSNMSLTSLPSTKNNYAFSETSTLNSSMPLDNHSSSDFTPTSVLYIQTAGKAAISLPFSTNDLAVPIFGNSENPTYLSIRPNCKSGTCFLVLADDETQSAIARTTYRFGPGKPPVVRIGADDDISADTFEMIRLGMFTRTVAFETREGKFRWRYANKKEKKQSETNAYNLLVLEKQTMVDLDNKKAALGWVRLAQLVRGEGSRTPGSKKSAAGNGGRLELNLAEKEKISEAGVVATCMVMLKKEIDVLRTKQIAIMTAVISGAT